jgi:hypothetical protein
MQVQPKSIDNSQNVLDIRKARNANELITVIGRINTTLRQKQTQFATEQTKVKFGPLPKLYDALSFVLQSQAELQCAATQAQHLQDAKRERCVQAVLGLNQDFLELKKTLITRINSASKPLMSKRLDEYANAVHDFLRPMCEKLYAIHMYQDNVACIAFVARQVQTQDGFTSPEVCVKLTEINDVLSASLPYNPFVDADQIPVSNLKDLDYFLKASLQYKRSTVPKLSEDKLLRIEGVTSVDVSDTLNLNLDQAVRPADINGILRVVIPLLKRSFARGQFEVLHRFNNTPDNRSLQLCIGKRQVVDPRALSRLTRLLGMTKIQINQMNDLLETP